MSGRWFSYRRAASGKLLRTEQQFWGPGDTSSRQQCCSLVHLTQRHPTACPQPRCESLSSECPRDQSTGRAEATGFKALIALCSILNSHLFKKWESLIPKINSIKCFLNLKLSGHTCPLQSPGLDVQQVCGEGQESTVYLNLLNGSDEGFCWPHFENTSRAGEPKEVIFTFWAARHRFTFLKDQEYSCCFFICLNEKQTETVRPTSGRRRRITLKIFII